MSVSKGSQNWKDLTPQLNDQPVLVVLGNEGKGLRSLVEQKCHHLAKLEPRHGPSSLGESIDSLNVATALGVALYSLLA